MFQTRVEPLPRGHITAALTKVLSFPLTVLTAPSGYGKTTAARILAQSLAWPHAWLTVPKGADSARYLWNLLCARLGEQGASGSTLAPLLRHLGIPESSEAIDRALEHIRKDLSRPDTSGNGKDGAQDGRFLLILDDWHFANFPELDAFLERLTREAVPGLSILLLSRTRPGLELEDLRVKGLARVFDRDLLAFSAEETVAYFALHGIDDADAARDAWKTCEGWPAALWLGVQAYQAHGRADAGRSVENLLEHTVFPRYAPEEQRLLLQCSVLESFTPEEAALVADDAAAPERLLRLHENNAFLTYDTLTGGYRLHSLFRAFLAAKLETEEGIDNAALYRRAGERHIAAGDLLQAAHAFHQAGREEDLLRLLEIFTLPGGNLLLFFAAQTVMPLVLSIPWTLRAQSPVAYLAFIYCVMAEHDPLNALPLLEEAEQRLAPGNPVGDSLPEYMRRRLRGEIILIRSLFAFNDLWAMRDLHAEAHAMLGGRSAISSRHMIWNFACPHVSFLYLREPGSYRDMVELVEGNLHYYHDLADGCSQGAQPLFRAEYLLERGEFAEVEAHARAAILQARTKDQTTTVLCAAFCLARLRMVQGGPEEALAVLRGHAPEVETLGHTDLFTCLDLAQGYVAGCLDRYDAVPHWLREGDFSPARAIPQTAGFIMACHGKALLLSGDYARLEAVAKSLPEALGPFDNLFGRIHAKVMEAVAVWNLHGFAPGRTHDAGRNDAPDSASGQDRALALLAGAVDLARPDGLFLSIAEYGNHALPLLRTLRKHAPDDAFLAVLVRMAERRFSVSHGAAAKRSGTPLTPREEKTLRLAAQGLSNAAIAEILEISPEAVKKRLSAAYKTLGAANRAEAVRRFLERN